jgi:hypothetical protein
MKTKSIKFLSALVNLCKEHGVKIHNGTILTIGFGGEVVEIFDHFASITGGARQTGMRVNNFHDQTDTMFKTDREMSKKFITRKSPRK